MSVILGFVLGATLPTYALLSEKKIVLGDVGEWAGAIATFFAVWVSLYLANKSEKANLRIDINMFNPFLSGDNMIFDIVNTGASGASVKIVLELNEEFIIKYIEAFPDVEDRQREWLKIKQVVDSIVREYPSNAIIKPTERVTIANHNSISVLINPMILSDWLYYNCPFSGEYKMWLTVEDINGQVIQQDIVKHEFTIQLDSDFSQH